jgi:hypothetical protein
MALDVGTGRDIPKKVNAAVRNKEAAEDLSFFGLGCVAERMCVLL